jgi:hypothetical protein
MGRSCDTLLREIRENQGHLTRGDDRKLFSYIQSRETVDFSNTVFDVYAFQSVIHSGLLTYFDESVQSGLAQLYSRIDSHNEILKYMGRLATEFSLFGRWRKVENYRKKLDYMVEPERYELFLAYRAEREGYELFLTRIDEEIRQLSPIAEQSLESVRQKNLIRI